MVSDTQTSAPLPPTKKRWLRAAALMLCTLVLLLAIGISALFNMERGAHYAFSLLSTLTQGTVQADGIGGTLAGPLRLNNVNIRLENQSIKLSDVRMDWQPTNLLVGKLKISSLNIAKLAITNKIDQKKQPATGLPDNIDLPLRMQIDQVRIASGSVSQGPVEILSLDMLNFGLNFDGNRYAFNLDSLSASSTTESAAFATTLTAKLKLSTRKPYAIDATMRSESADDAAEQILGANGTVRLTGSLAEMKAAIALQVAHATLNGDVTVRPFDNRILGVSHLEGKALNLAQLKPGLPKTDVDLHLDVLENGNGTLSVTNADAGLYNDNRLPVKKLSIDFLQSDTQFTLAKITAALGTRAQLAGNIAGKGSYADQKIALQLHTQKLNLQQVDSRLRATRLTGDAELRTTDGKQQITINLKEALDKNTLQLDAHASIADSAIDVDRFLLTAGDSTINVNAHIALSESQDFSVNGKVKNFRLRELGNFSQLPKLHLNGDFSVKGMRQPQLQAEALFNLNNSTLNDNPLNGEGELRLRTDSLQISKLSLTAGANHISAKGTLENSDSQIKFAVDAPKLAQIGSQFAGALKVDGTISGNLSKPRIIAEWNGKNIRAPKQLQASVLEGRADLTLVRGESIGLDRANVHLSASGLQSGEQRLKKLQARGQFARQKNAPLSLTLDATGMSVGQAAENHLTVNVTGTTARHQMNSVFNSSEQQWTLRASGGLQEKATALQWDGNIDAIDGTGKFTAQLHSPAALQVTPKKIQLEHFRIDTDNAYVAIEQLVSDQNGINSNGKFEHLQLSELLSYLQAEPAVGGDLKLAGEWDLKYANTLNGTVAIRRESGDAIMNGNASVALGLTKLETSADINNGRVKLQMLAAGQQVGRIQARLNTAVGDGQALTGLSLSPRAAINGNISIDTPSLAWLGPLVSPALVTEGKLQSNITVNGTVGQPKFAGNISADGLHLLFADTGLDLKQGTLRATFRDDRLDIETLEFHNDGTLSITGPVALANQQIALNLAIKADRYKLLNRSDRKLVISGASNVAWREGATTAKGKFKVDSGFFDISAADMPALSDDVVVSGKQVKKAGETALALDLEILLGKGIKLTGRGLDALLVGSLKLYADAGEPLQAKGTLSIASGTFKAYGRKLDIEQGLLRFDGTLNNPGLDILAMRRGTEVEAGVSVRGTVMSPRITLVSEPSVPDAEKLSWLVLGRGLSGTDSSQAGQLQSAASALLAQSAASGLQAQIATAFGLDDFSIGSDDTNLQQRIVTLGKRISNRLYVGYQQGIDNTRSVLLLRYKLTKRISLEAQAGTDSALMVFYNFMFD